MIFKLMTRRVELAGVLPGRCRGWMGPAQRRRGYSSGQAPRCTETYGTFAAVLACCRVYLEAQLL